MYLESGDCCQETIISCGNELARVFAWMRRHEQVKKLFTLFAVQKLLAQSHTHSRYMVRHPFALVKRDRLLCVIKRFRA